MVDEYGPKTFDNFDVIRVVKDRWLKREGDFDESKQDDSKLDIDDIDKIYFS